MGHVLQAGAGQITARQAAVKAGIPMTVPATAVNKVCLSGLDAIAQAADLIRLGEFDVIVAGGMESMTNAPHLLKNSRKGYKYGAVEMLDSMAVDGLTDVFDGLSMGESTERHNAQARHQPCGPGRVRRPLAAARRPGHQGRPDGRGDHPSRDQVAQGDDRLQLRRGHPRRHHRRVASRGFPPPSARTARSPPAPRRRSPTAPPRSS